MIVASLHLYGGKKTGKGQEKMSTRRDPLKRAVPMLETCLEPMRKDRVVKVRGLVSLCGMVALELLGLGLVRVRMVKTWVFRVLA